MISSFYPRIPSFLASLLLADQSQWYPGECYTLKKREGGNQATTRRYLLLAQQPLLALLLLAPLSHDAIHAEYEASRPK